MWMARDPLLLYDLYPKYASCQERLHDSVWAICAAVADLHHGHAFDVDFLCRLAFVWVSAFVQLGLDIQQLLLEFLDLLRRELRIVSPVNMPQFPLSSHLAPGIACRQTSQYAY